MVRLPLVMLPFLLLLTTVPAHSQVIPRCAACGQVLGEDRVKVGELLYHPDHFACQHCRRPIDGEYMVYDGRNYHIACYNAHVAPRCVLCNRAVADSCFTDFWGDAWHLDHRADVPLCDFCGRPIVRAFAGGSATLPDGRRLCGICAPTSVTTEADARRLMVEASRLLAQDGIVVATDDVILLLVGRDRLKKLNPDPALEVKGFTDRVAAPDSTTLPTANISLLYGMPRTQTIAVLAHELMHVWLFYRDVPQSGDALSEGCCEFAARLAMIRLGGLESEYVLHTIDTATHPAYGGGYRRVKHFVDVHGVPSWLAQLSGGTFRLPEE